MNDASTIENKVCGQRPSKAETLSLGLVGVQPLQPNAKTGAISDQMEEMIREAAQEVWIAQQIGTQLPLVVVEGYIWMEDSYTECVVKERISADEGLDGGGVAIQNGWIKEIEASLPPDGATLLRDLVNRRDVVPATMLLHAVLHALSRSPIENATKILELCDFAGLSPDKVKYKDAALRGLKALSEAINKKRYSRASMVVHRALRQRGNHQCFPGFIHEAKPRAAADFI
jgi:hypothetical protein